MMAAPFAVLAFISYPEFHREWPFFVSPLPVPGFAGASEPAVLAAQNMAMFLAVLAFGSVMALVVSRQRLVYARTETAIRQVREQSQQMARMNQQMSDYSSKVYDLAAAEERNRIAGEIHDTVAHRLTALVVQLRAARRLISGEKARSTYGPANDGRETSAGGAPSDWAEESASAATSNLEVCEALAREALDEVRSSVRAIRRPADAEGLDVLRQLAANFGALTSMDVTLDIQQGLPLLPARIIASIYRVLEEALTNARRHGQATRVNVAIAQVRGAVAVQVDDNGRGSEEVEFGFGLSSMRDRLQAVGAQLEVNSALGSGFSIRFQIPIWEGES